MTTPAEGFCYECGATNDGPALCSCPRPNDVSDPSDPSGEARLALVPDASDGSDRSYRRAADSLHLILDDLVSFAADFIACPKPDMGVAWALWVAHTYVLDHFDSTPRLGIVAPEKQSGKTRVLEVTEAVVLRPERSSDVSVAAIFRMISTDAPPVILLDEADAIWYGKGTNEELRSLVNGGHRKGNTVLRMVGEGAAMKNHRFETFAAIALAGIGDLPETGIDRCVVLRV